MNFKRIAFASIIIVLCIICSPIYGQEADDEIEQVLESEAEAAVENYDFSEIGESMDHYKRNPINLNSASKDQLKQLFFLTPVQINALLSHRDKNGLYMDILELQGIDAIDPETLEKLIPFITLKPVAPLSQVTVKELLTNGEHDLMVRFGRVLEKQDGFKIQDTLNSTAPYPGSSERLFTRYRYHFQNKLAIGVTMEKDPGEAFLSGAQKKGFDFYSGFISLEGSSALKKVIVGDYALQFGQGLTMWSGLGFGKGSALATIVKNEAGLRAHSSANEVLFLRGAAAAIVLNKLSLTPFVSFRFLDGNLDLEEETKISSFNESGFHRTVSELENRNAVTQFIYGSSAAYEYKNLKVGTILYQTKYNYPFKDGEPGYRQFNFAGASLTNAGIYYNYNWRNLYFFGEVSHSLHSGYAYLSGLIASLSKQMSFATIYRNYEKDYHSFFNQALSESSDAVNEKAFYSGIIISPNSKIEISMYTDVFSFPWLRYRVNAPSKGYEILSQLSYSLNKGLKLLVRYKVKNKEENSDTDNTVIFLESIEKSNCRVEINYKINSSFYLRNRIERVSYQKGDMPREFGYLMYQDVIYQPLDSRFSGNARFAIFDTDGFDSRVYTYERDVLYSYSLPGFQNRGIRFYVNGRYKLKRGFDFWIKYAITKYTNIEQIGTGLDRIDRNQKSEIKAQVRIQF